MSSCAAPATAPIAAADGAPAPVGYLAVAKGAVFFYSRYDHAFLGIVAR